MPILVYLGATVIASLMFFALAQTVRNGVVALAPLVSFVISPTLLIVIAVVVEGRNFSSLTNPDIQPLAALYGDGFIVPAAAFVLALAYREVQKGKIALKPRYRGLTYVIWCFAGGVALGGGFFLYSSVGYGDAGSSLALWSASKVWHDFVVYPALSGALIGLSLPLILRKKWTWHNLVLVGCFLLWFALVMYDTFFHGLNVSNLHPNMPIWELWK